ncbi:MAG: IS110 family transposase [Acidobacteriota bacterium]
MKRFFGCDAHKRYSMFASMNEAGHLQGSIRVENDRFSFQSFLRRLPPRSTIAIESVGNWYWMIDEMERAGHIPRLAHAVKAKLMMGQINKTDKLDARGLALLLRNGTLPSVWIPPGELRDQRELPRMRMTLVHVRTMLKNRIHATLAKYALDIPGVSNIFGVTGRLLLRNRLEELPPYTRRSVETQLELLDQVEAHIQWCEKQIKEVVATTPAMKLLMTLPGVGPILGVVIAMEIGDINRFPSPHHLASYAGTVPRIKSSGGKTFFGKVRPDVNRYLKWALVEAANVVTIHYRRWPGVHVAQLYRRIMQRKGHAKAVVAVARHLAEAAYWVLKRNESYKQPQGNKPISSTRK